MVLRGGRLEKHTFSCWPHAVRGHVWVKFTPVGDALKIWYFWWCAGKLSRPADFGFQFPTPYFDCGTSWISVSELYNYNPMLLGDMTSRAPTIVFSHYNTYILPDSGPKYIRWCAVYIKAGDRLVHNFTCITKHERSSDPSWIVSVFTHKALEINTGKKKRVQI